MDKIFKCSKCDFETKELRRIGGHMNGHRAKEFGRAEGPGYKKKSFEELSPITQNKIRIAQEKAAGTFVKKKAQPVYPKSLEECKTDKSRRKFIIREIGHGCMECNIKEWNGLPINLELDHIDGNHRNNTRENLRVICPNCHALTDNYRGRNAKNKSA